MSMIKEDDNLSYDFRFHKNEEPAPKTPDIKEYDLNLMSQSSNTKNCTRIMLLGYIP